MSSAPEVHCIEGRDWEGVLRGLAAGESPVNRPHLPAYAEVSGADYLWNFSRISRLSVAMVPSDTLLYPELENWPHSRFSKSRTFTRFQIEFDHYGSTHSPETRQICEEIWAALRKADLISENEVSQLYDPVAGTFLADRFVKGTCPNPQCRAPDQYPA